MTLRDLIDDITDDEYIFLKLDDYEFASDQSFRKYRVNKMSKLLDCKVQSIGSAYVGNECVIIVRVKCEDLNDLKNFFKKE